MRVLITGITGFIGSNLAHRLLEKGHEVYGLIRHVAVRDFKALQDILPKITLLNADLNDRYSVQNAIKKCNPEAILHLGALSPVRMCFEQPFESMQTNLLGTMNIVYAVMDLGITPRVVVASSAEVYGWQTKEKFTEDLPLNPTSNYSIAKQAIDSFIRMVCKINDFNGVVLRCANTFGRKYDRSFFTEYLIDKMLKNEDIYIGNPDSIRDYIFVDDHVNAYILAMEKPEAKGHVFGIGGGIGFTNSQWATKIADVLGFDKSKLHLGQFPPGYPVRPTKSDQSHIIIDASKAKEILGWSQTVSAEEGIKKTIEFLRN